MCYDSFRHHRRSIRMKGYDYSSDGAYFVTICTRERADLFGDVINGIMNLNDFGKLANEVWRKLSGHFPNMELDEWVVMPNHVHGIIWIVSPVGAGYSCPNVEKGARTAPLRRTLGQAVAYFKHQSNKAMNVLWGDLNPAIPVWQRNYYERIIRDDEELDRIRQYIRDNPQNWDQDPENILMNDACRGAVLAPSR